MTAFTPKPGRLTLQGCHTRDLDQVLLPELAHPLELLADELDLALLGRNLVGHALDLLAQLVNALLQLPLLTETGSSA